MALRPTIIQTDNLLADIVFDKLIEGQPHNLVTKYKDAVAASVNFTSSCLSSDADPGNPFGSYATFKTDDGYDLSADFHTSLNRGSEEPINGLAAVTLDFWTSSPQPNNEPITSLIVDGILVADLTLPTQSNNNTLTWRCGHTGNPTDGESWDTLQWTGTNDPAAWTHWTVTKDPSINELALYRNGIKLAKGTSRLSITMQFDLRWSLGVDTGSYQYWNGKMARVRFWSVALSEGEVARLHREDIRKPYTGGPLLAYFRMSEVVSGNQIPSEVGGGIFGTANGNPTLATDNTALFDRWLSLDGTDDWLDVALDAFIDLKSQVSIDFWAHWDMAQNATILAGMGLSDREVFTLKASDNSKMTWTYGSDVATLDLTTLNPSPETPLANKWHHWALVKDIEQKTLQLYLDGTNVATTSNAAGAFDYLLHVSVGVNKAANQYWKGDIARLRFWNRALSQDEVRLLGRVDEGLLPKQALDILPSPIRFVLYDNDHQPAIYISDIDENKTLTLQLTNAGQFPFTFKKITTFNTSEYHLELRFRPGTLLEDGKGVTLQAANGWSALNPQLNSDRTVSIFLACNADLDLPTESQNASNATIRLTVKGVRAAAGTEGTRGTRVELRYRNISLQGQKELLQGSLLHYLNVINHRGEKIIPLYAGFVGSNTVLNDDKTDNELLLAVTNTQPQGKNLPSICFKTGEGGSKLMLSFDQLGEDLNVCTIDVLEGSTLDKVVALRQALTQGGDSLEKQKDKNWLVDPKPQGSRNQWTLTPQHKDHILAPGQVLLIGIRKLKTGKPVGQARLYLDYEDVPGYWDGQLQLTIEKSPLVIRAKSVGIGTDEPGVKLDTNGKRVLDETDGFLDLYFTKLRLRDHASWLLFSHYNGANYIGSGNCKETRYLPKDGDVADLYFANYGNTKKWMVIKEDGRVGIDPTGNNPDPDPSTAFHVKGNIQADGQIQVKGQIKDAYGALLPPGSVIQYAGKTPPDGWLLCNGDTKSTHVYKALFDVIKYTYGGGGDSFQLPDLQCKFVVGATPEQAGEYSLGAKGGFEKIKLEINEMPQHDHTATHNLKGSFESGNQTGDNQYVSRVADDENGDITFDISGNITVGQTGGIQAHENRPPYVALNYIIKY
jgi:microcystin-dependent protein